MGGKTGLNASVFTLRIQFKILHKVRKILRVGTTLRSWHLETLLGGEPLYHMHYSLSHALLMERPQDRVGLFVADPPQRNSSTT